MTPTLVIFARAPRIGQGKRRLATRLGRVAAWQVQRWMLDRALRRLYRDRRWRCVVAVTGGSARWPKGIRMIPQVRGDLGRRMEAAMRGHPPGPVVLVGTDVPDLGPRQVAEAFAALGTHGAVFGPAEDGGYWLVGLRFRPTVPDVFSGIEWSTPHTLADTLARLAPRHSYHLLDPLSDIDDVSDLRRWQSGRRTRLPYA